MKLKTISLLLMFSINAFGYQNFTVSGLNPEKKASSNYFSAIAEESLKIEKELKNADEYNTLEELRILKIDNDKIEVKFVVDENNCVATVTKIHTEAQLERLKNELIATMNDIENE